MTAQPRRLFLRWNMLFLDNAATSFPKPAQVTEAMVRFATEVGASPGRGAYRPSVEAARLIATCRERVARLVNLHTPDNVVFTLNATDALNQAIKGVVRARLRTGSAVHAVSTDMDHNSILRPLNALREEGLAWTCVKADPSTGRIDPDDVRRAITPETALVAIGHASNVTGTIQDVGAIGAVCRERDVLLIVDAAQSAGHVPIDMEADRIDLLCVPGHKGLLGPLGTGAMVIRPGIESRVVPLREGGTGSISDLDVQPGTMPDRYESGSQNAIGLVGLSEGVAWLLDRSIDALWAHEQALATRLVAALRAIEGVDVLAPDAPRVAVVSIRHEGAEPHVLAMLLEQQGVLARAGLHCAPRAHQLFGTLEAGGALRLSAGPFTTLEDIDAACDAVATMAACR